MEEGYKTRNVLDIKFYVIITQKTVEKEDDIKAILDRVYLMLLQGK